jgi:[acyl-carrier-protein] S-malonyltransferase
MKAFLFPGQGSQEIGMAAELFQTDAAFCQLVQQASDCAGADLKKVCLRGPERELAKAEHVQPLLVAVSLGYWGKLVQSGIEPEVVLGHSLGEITALAAAGMLTAEAAVKVAAQRGRIMGAAAARMAGGMMAVLSPRRQPVLDALAQLLQAGRVFLANDNAPDQLLFSGSLTDLEEAARLISGAKLATCRKLSVSGPWHCPLMLEAQREFAVWLQTLPLQSPRVPVLMNVSASPESDPEEIRRQVVRNLTEPVQWRACLERLRAMQPRVLLEIGPRRVLSGLARANGFGDEVQIFNINNLRGLNFLVHSLNHNC